MEYILGNISVSGFYIETKFGYVHYTWSCSDCVFWNDDTDDEFYFDVPKEAVEIQGVERGCK